MAMDFGGQGLGQGHRGEEDGDRRTPKINGVWSIGSNQLLTPSQVGVNSDSGMMETGSAGAAQSADRTYQLPPPSLRVRVQLPERFTLFENGVQEFELLLLYGKTEQELLTVHIPEEIHDLPAQEGAEIGINENDDATINDSVSVNVSSLGENQVVINETDHHSPQDQESSPDEPLSDNGEELTTLDNSITTEDSLSTPPSILGTPTQSEETISKKIVQLGIKHGRNHHGFMKQRLSSRVQDIKERKESSNDKPRIVVSTRERPYRCNKCGKDYLHRSNLTHHLRLHDPNPASRRPFHCPQCYKSFTKGSSLTTHRNTVHLKRQDFKCLQCGRKFGEKSAMTKHYNATHLGIRHPCENPNCGKTFSRRDYLQKHCKQVHKAN